MWLCVCVCVWLHMCVHVGECCRPKVCCSDSSAKLINAVELRGLWRGYPTLRVCVRAIFCQNTSLLLILSHTHTYKYINTSSTYGAHVNTHRHPSVGSWLCLGQQCNRVVIYTTLLCVCVRARMYECDSTWAIMSCGNYLKMIKFMKSDGETKGQNTFLWI